MRDRSKNFRTEIHLPWKFTPRVYQVPLYAAAIDLGFKRFIMCWHRRAGKDKSLFNIMIMKSMLRVGIYYYFLPTLKQGRKVMWDGMDKDGFKMIDHIPHELIASTNATEMKVTLINGSLIQIVGSDSIDSIMGSNPIGCVFSEYALQDPRGWDYVRPILRENGGWAAFNSTPRGKNHFFKLLELSKDNPEWFSQTLTIKDTGVLNDDDIEAERKSGMSEDLINQEFYCSFEASNPGAYYGTEMRRADEQGRICSIPIETGTVVNTYWDLGMDDSTAIWFHQSIGREERLINYYETSGESLAHYVRVISDFLDRNGCVGGETVLPHDGAKRELGTGKSIQDLLFDLGVRASLAQRPNRKEDAIELSRQLLSRCWFDRERCARGIECLRHYHKTYDEVNGVYRVTPVHDWSSHGADAFTTMALGIRTGPSMSGFRPKR